MTVISKSKVDIASWSASKEKEVYICGVGARTPLGFNVAATSAAVRAAISVTNEHPFFIDKSGDPINIACDAGLDPTLAVGIDVANRMNVMLRSAITEALDNATLSCNHVSFPCWICFPEPRPGLLPDAFRLVSFYIASKFSIRQEQVYVSQKGHSAALIEMQKVASLISSGKIDIGLVAGVDSYHSRATLDWLDETGALLSSKNRNGFVPSEAASACLLASSTAVNRYHLPVLGKITAAATAIEPHPIRGEEVSIGEGLSAVMKEILASLRYRKEFITDTYCDLNGERYRNEEFLYTLLRTQSGFLDAHNYQSPADCWGDVGAASGLLFSCLAVTSKQRGYAKGAVPILWTSSESGYRAALLLNLE